MKDGDTTYISPSASCCSHLKSSRCIIFSQGPFIKLLTKMLSIFAVRCIQRAIIHFFTLKFAFNHLYFQVHRLATAFIAKYAFQPAPTPVLNRWESIYLVPCGPSERGLLALLPSLWSKNLSEWGKKMHKHAWFSNELSTWKLDFLMFNSWYFHSQLMLTN